MSLLILALLTSASALRVSDPKPKLSLWESVFDKWTRPSPELPQKFEEHWKAEATYTPPNTNIQTYGAQFAEKHGDAIKLVVGIPMMPSQPEVLKAHMSTWMTGEGICDVNSYNKPDCHIFPVFVYGNSSAAAAKASELGIHGVSLPVPEPTEALKDDGYATRAGNAPGKGPANIKERAISMRGKSYEWFKHASQSFKWATHIGKLDSDAFPHFKWILKDLASGPKQNAYWGAAMGGEECKQGFMQGAFYIESANLEECRQKQVDQDFPDFYRGRGWQAHEDGFFGDSLYKAMNAGKCPPVTCMNVRRSKRYIHPV